MESPAGRLTRRPWEWAVIYAGYIGLSWLIVTRAWVCEDAYITFRVIDNFFAGHGLRWNIHERVQAYTHPLWMLLHLPLRAVWDNIFLVNITLSIACTLAAIAMALATRERSLAATLALFLLPLGLSKTFIDYTTSGLENPLTYLTFAFFGYVVVRLQTSRHFWFFLSFSVALALFNRLDTLILYAPALAWLVISRNDRRWRQILLGALPLIGWLSFALFYYGFLFPNTKYAKLGTGLDLLLYLRQGAHYAKYLLMLDTPGALALASSVYFILRRGCRLSACLGLGVYGYCLYVFYIGGDYMAGRFWAFPLFVAIWLWYVFGPRGVRTDVLFAAGCVLIAAHATAGAFFDIRKSCPECLALGGRVLDAGKTFGTNRLFKRVYPPSIRKQGEYHFSRRGRSLAARAPEVEKMWYVGMIPYYGGARIKVIDELGLADPLLARLPAITRQYFYIGHFRRRVPAGYEQALRTGSLEGMDPALAHYYEKLRLITSAPLFDKERLLTIVRFNLGKYEPWKEEYLARARP